MVRLLSVVTWLMVICIRPTGCAGQPSTSKVPGSAAEPISADETAVGPTFAVAPGPTVEPELPATGTPEAGALPSRPASRGRVATFVLAPGETTLSYAITESVMYDWGRPATVTGSTRAVEGQFMLDYDYPSHSQFSPITANVRTLQSDEPARDQTLQEEWLESERYPVAVFVAKEVRGFPSDAGPGQLERGSPDWQGHHLAAADRLLGSTALFARGVAVIDGVTVTLDFTFETGRPTQ